MFDVSESERNEVVSLCREFLSDVWSKADDHQIDCRRITYGFVNKTFHVRIKDGALENDSAVEQKDVLVRLYSSGVFGNKNVPKINGEASEVIVHQRLSEVGLASKLFGVFNGGRIEEYIPSRPSTADDLKSIDLCKEIVRKFVKFHTVSMPLPKKPNFLDYIASVVKQTVIPSDYAKHHPNEVEECKMVVDFQFEKEFLWMKDAVPKVGQKVIFSHNETSPSNILLRENVADGENIVLVDYELSCYFYRAYDLACFIHLRTGRYKRFNDRIELSFDEEDNSIVDELLQEYLNEYRKLHEDEFDPKFDNLERLRMEVEFFNLVYDLLTVAVMKSILVESEVPFPMFMGANCAKDYGEKKKLFFDKFGDPVEWTNSDSWINNLSPAI